MNQTSLKHEGQTGIFRNSVCSDSHLICYFSSFSQYPHSSIFSVPSQSTHLSLTFIHLFLLKTRKLSMVLSWFVSFIITLSIPSSSFSPPPSLSDSCRISSSPHLHLCLPDSSLSVPYNRRSPIQRFAADESRLDLAGVTLWEWKGAGGGGGSYGGNMAHCVFWVSRERV